MRRCATCSDPISPLARADARFCSTRCRVAAHRSRRRLPAALVSRPRWVRHRSKVPVTTSGAPASSTDPSTWTDHATASRSEVGDGLGFVLGDGIGCIDLDHCLTDGRLASWAADLLDRLPVTYVEVSPSGAGLHVWGLIPEGPGRKVGDVEVYSVGRYITVTGERFGDCPSSLADLSAFHI